MKCIFSKIWKSLRTCIRGQSAADTPSSSGTDDKEPHQPLLRRDPINRYESRTPSPTSMELPASAHSVETDDEWKELEEMRNRMMHPPRNHSVDSDSVVSNDSGFDSSPP